MEYEHNKSGKHYSKFILVQPFVWLAKVIFRLTRNLYYSFKNRGKYEKYKNQKI